MDPPATTTLPTTEAGTAAQLAPAGRVGVGRIFAAITLPLLFAAGAVVAIGPVFEGRIAFVVDSSDTPAIVAKQQARTLSAAGWQAASQPAAQTGVQWRIADFPTGNGFELVARGRRPADLRSAMNALEAAIASRLADEADAHRERIDREQTPLLAERAQIQTALLELEHVLAAGTSAAPPWEMLTEACGAMDRDGQALRQTRAELELAVAQRDALEHAPPPSTAVVDPKVRDQAYRANIVLQQDQRRLEVQLAEIRTALLDLWQSASRNLDDILESAEQLAQLGDAPEAAGLPAKARTQLEQTAEAASDYHLRSAAFAQDWTRTFLGLQALKVDPDSPEILRTHDRLVKLVNDYRYHTTRQLTALRTQARELSEDTGAEARRHVLTSMATRRLFALEGAARRFEADTAELVARGNYLLDAALESARALLHRTEGVRLALDNELDQQARQRALAQRRTKIETLSEHIDELRDRMHSEIDTVLMSGASVQDRARSLPQAVQASADRHAARQQKDWFAGRIATLDRRLAELSSANSSALWPYDVKTVATGIDRMPVNLTSLLLTGVLAWGTAFLVVVAFRPTNHGGASAREFFATTTRP